MPKIIEYYLTQFTLGCFVIFCLLTYISYLLVDLKKVKSDLSALTRRLYEETLLS